MTGTGRAEMVMDQYKTAIVQYNDVDVAGVVILGTFMIWLAVMGVFFMFDVDTR